MVKFNQFHQREMVRKHAKVLKGREQFPKSVQEARQLIWPVFKKAREENKRALIIRGKNYISTDHCTWEHMQIHYNRGREPMAREPDLALLVTLSGSRINLG